MKVSVTFVEFPSWDDVIPLVSGYLQVYSQEDPVIRDACTFTMYTQSIPIDVTTVARELADLNSDVYAFSCYMWNIRSVARVLSALLHSRPSAKFILGGPQVINHAATYVPKGETRIVVCNGEGEITFREYLRHIVTGSTDLSLVPGITYWDGKDFATTTKPSRIQDLDQVPSPFTAGIFLDGQYTSAILETNRGCPFSCGFCYWGAATNDKVYKFDEERVRRDIQWLSENGILNIFIADANWGISPRDVGLSRYMVACSKKTGFPVMVYMAAAKNKPERMSEITELLCDGGLLACQPISLQTITSHALDLIDRSNIKLSTYSKLQEKLREKQISSYVELIWPLPGDTLETFMHGAAQLCRAKADGLIIYPHLLLHNTTIYLNQELHGIKIRKLDNGSGEAELVVATKWVTEEECTKGYWFYHSVLVLYNLRGLYFLANHLDALGLMKFENLFLDFGIFLSNHSSNPVASFLQDGMKKIEHYDVLFSGIITHLVLHEMRGEFDELLYDYASQQDWWSNEFCRTLFELDLVARPYVYREPVRRPRHEFDSLSLISVEPDRFTIRASHETLDVIRNLENVSRTDRGGSESLEVVHDGKRKLPVSDSSSYIQNGHYCHGMMFRIRETLPDLNIVTS
jgi:hypothetical protein